MGTYLDCYKTYSANVTIPNIHMSILIIISNLYACTHTHVKYL